jgi:hypothetical protein
MSHRIKLFAAFAIFARFYHFAVVDSISGLFGHQMDTKLDTKITTATTKTSLSDKSDFGVQSTRSTDREIEVGVANHADRMTPFLSKLAHTRADKTD